MVQTKIYANTTYHYRLPLLIFLYCRYDNYPNHHRHHALQVITHEPTRHPQGEEIQVGNVRFKTFDMGGHEAARRLWQNYFANVDGIVYIVDAADPTRFSESRRELTNLLANDALQTVPFMVLGNKIDRDGAVSRDILKQELGLHNLTTGADGNVPDGIRPLELFMCSVVRRSGYIDGFKWLNKFV